MKYNNLGNTGVFVSELCLGMMTIGGQGYWEVIGTLDASEATQLVKAFKDAGGNFIDTADAYGYGNSETFTGEAIQNSGVHRHEWVLATKGYLRMGPGVNNVGASRLHITHAIENSLKRLKTEYIDLYQIHAVDPITPLEETMRALEDAVRSGKVLYTGICNMPAWKVAKANGISDKMGWTKFSSTQNYYSLAGRDIEHDIIPAAIDMNMAILPWSPLSGGYLSGKYRKNEAMPEGGRRTNFNFPPVAANVLDIVEVMHEVAVSIDATVAQVALAWMLNQKGITSIIFGAKNVAQLEDNLGSTLVKDKLTSDHLSKLDAVSKPAAIYPAWMMERSSGQRFPQ
jgi:aryl-alcohol dehydrogenase-like predicted oxidoreductase